MTENCLVRIMAPSELWQANKPDVPKFVTEVVQRAVEASGRVHSDSEVSLVLSDDRELRLLNNEHRGIDKATNVLAFPGEPLDDEGGAYTVRARPLILGDIVLSYERVVAEAEDQGKTFDHHLAHLLVHGTLHLCRYDHERNEDAERMENLERRVLKAMGIGDPYAELPPKEEAAPEPVPPPVAAPAAAPKAQAAPRKPAPGKPAPKKPALKKAAAKKVAPKKLAAKKAPAKRAAAKKPVAKKAPARKPAPRKAAPKKKAPPRRPAARKSKPARRSKR